MTQSEVRQMFIKNNPGVRRPGKKGYWYRCAHCGKWCGRPGHDNVKIPDDQKMEVDHIKPWWEGGSDALWNLAPLCKPCNRTKSANPTLQDDMKILKNDIVHGDLLPSMARKAVRQNKFLRDLGITKRK